MIHPTVIVEAGAQIAPDVTIGAYSIIGGLATIGPGCRIGPHVVIAGRTTLGADNRVFQFASIGEAPQDKKYADEDTELVIGDGNTIREYCTFNRGTAQGGGATRIGDDNWFMAYVHIAHDCQVGSHTIFANGATLAGHVTVGDYAVFAGYSGAHQFCNIGAHAFLGMYGGVSKDVPAYLMVSGQPPKPRGINSEGLRRRGYTEEQVRNIREAYKVLYLRGLCRDDAVAELRRRAESQSELMPMIESVEASTRGLLR